MYIYSTIVNYRSIILTGTGGYLSGCAHLVYVGSLSKQMH